MRDQFNFAKYILDNPLLKEEQKDPLEMDYSEAAENLKNFIERPKDFKSILQQLDSHNAPYFKELGAEIMDVANSYRMKDYMPTGGNALGLAKYLVAHRVQILNFYEPKSER